MLKVISLEFVHDLMLVYLSDGRRLGIPIEWFPRLAHATPSERKDYELSNEGIHWPELDEDISLRGLLAGNGSKESAESIREWLQTRPNPSEHSTGAYKLFSLQMRLPLPQRGTTTAVPVGMPILQPGRAITIPPRPMTFLANQTSRISIGSTT